MSNFRTIDRPEPTDPDRYLANLRPKCHLVRVKRVNSNPLMVVATVDPSRHRYNRLTS